MSKEVLILICVIGLFTAGLFIMAMVGMPSVHELGSANPVGKG